MDTLKRVIEQISNLWAGIGEEEICAESKLNDDLVFDSLDYVDLAVKLEKEFDIKIEDDVIDEWKTVQDVVDYVDKLLQQ